MKLLETVAGWFDVLVRARRRLSNRRGDPRFRIPLNVPLHCTPANAMSFEAEIVEMSRGGMAVMIFEATLNLPPGTVMNGCTFVLPGGEAVVVDVEVRNTSLIVRPGVGPMQRAGLKFLGRPKGVDRLLKMHGNGSAELREAPTMRYSGAWPPSSNRS